MSKDINDTKNNDSVESKSSDVGSSRMITGKSIGLSLVGMVLWAIGYLYVLMGRIPALPSPMVLPQAFALSIILIVAIAAGTLGRKYEFLRMSKGELSFSYICIAVTSMFINSQFLLITTYTSYMKLDYANVAGIDGVLGRINHMLLPSAEAALAYWEGGSTVPWADWILPLILWTLFFLCVVFVLAFLGHLLSKRWIEQEHFDFPLTVPVLITGSISEGVSEEDKKKGYDFTQKMFWLGGVIPFILFAFNTLHKFFPAVPSINLMINLDQYFTAAPWNPGITFWPGFVLYLDPIVIGIAYIIQLPVSFSIWFFYLVQRFSGLFFHAIGRQETILGEWTFLIAYVHWGALFGVGIFTLWNSQDTIKSFIESVTKKGDKNALLTAILLLLAAIYGIFFVSSMLGVELSITLMAFAWIVLATIGFANLRASSGVPISGLPFGIGHEAQTILGSKAISYETGVLLNHVSHHSMYLISSIPAWAAETAKINYEVKSKKENIAMVYGGIFIASMIIAIVIVFPALYRYGISYVPDAEPAILNSWGMNVQERGPIWGGAAAVVSGAAIAVGMAFMHANYIWFPFSAVGFAAGFNYGITMTMPASFFVAWLVKFLVFRYGGAQLHRKVLPFFIGMVIIQVAFVGIGFLIDLIVSLT